MDDGDHLVLAMPRRELFRINGFTRSIDLTVLASLEEDAWFAAPAALAGNFDAKEVRLGLVVARGGEGGDQLLVSEHGVLLHATPIPPDVGALGPGLRALRQLALVAGRHLVDSQQGTVEMIGYCNDDTLAECRAYFLLVYRLRLPAGAPAAAGMSWIALSHLARVPLDPVSTLIAAGLPG
jgi:hypothetical protein